MLKFMLVPACALVLAACGGSESQGPREGQYQQIVKITELDFPGMTEETKKQTIASMEGAAGGGTGGMYCMGTSGAGSQDWKTAATQMATSLGGQCTKTKDTASPTAVDLEMTCAGTDKGDVAVKFKATATREGYDGTMSFDIKDPATSQTAKIGMTISAKRQGDCP